MKLPMSWLSEFVDMSGVTNKEYADKMTMSGSKVEEVIYLGEEFKNVVTGRILSNEPHPDSDHLVICQVDVGKEEPIQIVTGAPNAHVGSIVPVALHKSNLPGGVKITKGKLRGVPSNGMMCSHEELGLTLNEIPYGDPDGLLLMPEDTPVGVDIRTVIGLDEYVTDFEITSNRPDCMSIIGLARETAATFNRPLQLHEPVVKGCGGDIREDLSVQVDVPELCPRYTARLVKNIKIEPSPAWMRERLHAAGVRPINNIVDITNYVMLEYGQPMHAFDYACLKDSKIIVRCAKEGEAIQTLDGQSHSLDETMICIADGTTATAVAGVMGGFESEITEKTNTVVFESANFHGATVRVTAKKLGMRTEASGRFEKGLDPRMTVDAVNRACELVEMLGAGEVVDGIIDVDATSDEHKRLPLECEKINALLGIALSRDEIVGYLERLGFAVENEEVIVPFFRTDILRMCDLAEEVARMYGYDNIPTTLFGGESVLGALTPKQQFEKNIGILARACGFDEALNFSFGSPKMYDSIGLPEDSDKRISVKILNPLGEEFSVMRTTALPTMLDCLMHNLNYRNETASLYEIATVYLPEMKNGAADPDILPQEPHMLALGTYGRLSFFQFKGIIERLLRSSGVPAVSFEPVTDNPSYHPGRCARVLSGETEIGVFGTIHPIIAKNYGAGSSELLAAELNLDTMFAVHTDEKLYHPLPKYPASTRDIAVLCDEGIPVAHMEKAITKAVGSILEAVTLFDVYKGNQVPDGKKSVAYSLRLRRSDRTLTDEECDGAMKKAISALEEKFGAELRR
ncbi:MAG TPA: phenylalanine--tRNA ligase subunit beta [Clostridiales bacterium]|nr:phenylalanine--tRNA ligase subunit beta [Clostridiales bacterium]